MKRGEVFEIIKTILAHKAEVTGPEKVGPVLLKYGTPKELLDEFLSMSLLDAVANLNVKELLTLAVLSEGV